MRGIAVKKKILLMIIFCIAMTACSQGSVSPNVEHDLPKTKDLTSLVSCLGYNSEAYKALGDLPEAEVKGEIHKYDLPSEIGFYSGFDFRAWIQDGVVKAFYLRPENQSIKIGDISLPMNKDKIDTYFSKQNNVQMGSFFEMSSDSLQYYDQEYVYVFYYDNEVLDAVEITTIKTYQEYMLVSSEVISGQQIEYNNLDGLLVEGYDGKLNNVLDSYYFDCESGDKTYFITFVGRFNGVEFIYGKRESEAYVLLEIDLIEDVHVALGGAPELTDADFLGISFRNTLGEENQVEISNAKNKILYKNQIDSNKKYLNNDKIILDKITACDGSGCESKFTIAKDDTDIDANNYLYGEIDGKLFLIATEKLSTIEKKNGCITNPQMIGEKVVSYTVTNTIDCCAKGLHYITRIVDVNTKRTEVFCECSISFKLDEYYAPYINYFISKNFTFTNDVITQEYHLLSPEGNRVTFLGHYLEPFFLLDQIEESMER